MPPKRGARAAKAAEETIQDNGEYVKELVPESIETTTLGIEKTDENKENVCKLITALAKSDFWHDFDITGDEGLREYVNKYLITSPNVFKITQAATVFKERIPDANNTFYRTFKGQVDQLLNSQCLPTSREFYREEDVIKLIGLNYIPYKKSLLTWTQGLNSQQNPNQPLGQSITTTQGRHYSISSIPFKNKKFRVGAEAQETDKYIDNIHVLRTLMGPRSAGDKVFSIFLLVDFSIFPLSRLLIEGRQKIHEVDLQEGDTMNIFLIKSTENDSDSAGKIGELQKGLASRSDGVDVNVYVLKDADTPLTFPSYYQPGTNQPTQEQNSNFGINFSFTTQRQENGDVNAMIDNGYVEENISKASKISQVAMEVVRKIVENWGVYNGGDSAAKRALLFEITLLFILKRAGDWCQALCLLDRTRRYTAYKFNNITGVMNDEHVDDMVDIPLEALVGRYPNHILALSTHDVNLLAFALLIGLDVFFNVSSFATGYTILSYFKNMDLSATKTVDPAAVAAEAAVADQLYRDTFGADIEEIFGRLRAMLEEKIARWNRNLPVLFDTLSNSVVYENGGAAGRGAAAPTPNKFIDVLVAIRKTLYLLEQFTVEKLDAVKGHIVTATATAAANPAELLKYIKTFTKMKENIDGEMYPNEQDDMNTLKEIEVLFFTQKSFSSSKKPGFEDKLPILSGILDGIKAKLGANPILDKDYSKITAPVRRASRAAVTNPQYRLKVLQNLVSTILIDKPIDLKSRGGGKTRRKGVREGVRKGLRKGTRKYRGGRIVGPESITLDILRDIFNSIRAEGNFVIVIKGDKFKEAGTIPYFAGPNFVAKQRSYIYKDNHYYSVLDNYLVDKTILPNFAEDEDIMEQIYNYTESKKEDKEHVAEMWRCSNYLTLRYRLLMHDLYYTELKGLEDDMYRNYEDVSDAGDAGGAGAGGDAVTREEFNKDIENNDMRFTELRNKVIRLLTDIVIDLDGSLGLRHYADMDNKKISELLEYIRGRMFDYYTNNKGMQIIRKADNQNVSTKISEELYSSYIDTGNTGITAGGSRKYTRTMRRVRNRYTQPHQNP